MRTKTLCTSCEQYVYTDADHSCFSAKQLRAVRDAEAAVVESAEYVCDDYDEAEVSSLPTPMRHLWNAVTALHAARGQSPQVAEGITRQGEPCE